MYIYIYTRVHIFQSQPLPAWLHRIPGKDPFVVCEDANVDEAMSQKLGLKLQRRFAFFFLGSGKKSHGKFRVGSKLGEFPKRTHTFFRGLEEHPIWRFLCPGIWSYMYLADELKSPGNGLLPMISFRVKWRWSSSWRAKTTLTRHVIMRFGTWNNGPHGRGDTNFGNDALREIWVDTTITYWKGR